jgi:hypothetical protein
MELPIEACQLCKKKLELSDSMELDIQECEKCHKLVCPDCIKYRLDLKKWLCNACYIENKPKVFKI